MFTCNHCGHIAAYHGAFGCTKGACPCRTVETWIRTSGVRRVCVTCVSPIPRGAMACPEHPTAAVRGEVVS